MRKLESDQAPQAVGPYSQAIVSGDLIFCSGQLGLDRQSGKMVKGGLEAQTHQAFKNVSYVLDEEGLTLDDLVKVTVYLADIEDFGKVNEIYAEYFEEPYPARSAFAVKDLPLGGIVEIEVIAEKTSN